MLEEIEYKISFGMNEQNNISFSSMIIKQPIGLLVFITCIVIISYFGIKIYKEIKPQTLEEKKMECLKLGSDARANACIRLLK